MRLASCSGKSSVGTSVSSLRRGTAARAVPRLRRWAAAGETVAIVSAATAVATNRWRACMVSSMCRRGPARAGGDEWRRGAGASLDLGGDQADGAAGGADGVHGRDRPLVDDAVVGLEED